MPDVVELTFWGVRGGIPTPVVENLGFGGNTPCVSVRHGDGPFLLLDAGSGFRTFGNSLTPSANGRIDVNILFTHFHWDHIQGIPFFAPLFRSNCGIVFHSAEPPDRLRAILTEQMRSPYFPVRFPEVQADCRYAQVDPAGLEVDGLRISSYRLCHPGGAHGYRIQSTCGAIVYATDHEHGDERVDGGLRNFARDADILIYDAQYTPEEYKGRIGFGHSTWLEATRVARDARVKQLVLFHHDPLHDDATMDGIVRAAQAEFPATVAAREGWTMCLPQKSE